MRDMILYVPSFTGLVAHLDEHHPDMLIRNDSGEVQQPPIITGFARTPARVNGDKVMVYARFREHEVEEWRGMEGVDILGEAEYVGRGTTAAVYDAAFSDPEAKAKYDSVYDYTPYEVTDEASGETYTVTPPQWFGAMAGG